MDYDVFLYTYIFATFSCKNYHGNYHSK